MAKPDGLIDIHHHMFPPAWLGQAEAGLRRTTRNLSIPFEWSADRSLQAMDVAGVDCAVLSLGPPGMDAIEPHDRPGIARRCNQFGAELKTRHPGRFLSLAALPMPDVDASLAELSFALDELGADGIAMMTNVEGIWPGDARFKPIFDELDRRAAVVHFHPTLAPQLAGIPPGVPPSILEFPVDTARAIATLLFSGTLSRCPSLRLVFSHAGGVLPALAGRIAALGPRDPGFQALVPEGALAALSRLYVDTAGSANRFALAPLLELLPPERIMFGSDFPYLPIADGWTELAGQPRLAQHSAMIGSGNARRLWPAAAGRDALP